jgi:hypothetical protein
MRLFVDPAGLPNGWGHWLLARRQITTDTTAPELAFYRCAGPAATQVTELIRVAGAPAGRARSACAPRGALVVFPRHPQLGGLPRLSPSAIG